MHDFDALLYFVCLLFHCLFLCLEFDVVFFAANKDNICRKVVCVCVAKLTENWNDVGDRRHRLANHEQEHHEGEKNGNLQVDLVSGLHREEEAEKGDDKYEETGCDEVDDVEHASATHVDGEGDIGIRFHATRVDCLVTFGRYSVHRPLLHTT